MIISMNEDDDFVKYIYQASDSVSYLLSFSKEYYCCEISVISESGIIRIDKELAQFINDQLKIIYDNY